MSELESPPAEPRQACPAPASIAREVERYDRLARVERFPAARHRMTCRILGDGPPLIVSPGVSSTYRGYAILLNRLAERFRTIIYDYPGDNPDDGANLRKIGHDELVDDVFRLIDHLNLGRVFLVGTSFGSTITLKALSREPRRFPKAVIQGAFAHRPLTLAERTALRFGRLFPGAVGRLPLHDRIIEWNHKCHFPTVIEDRFRYYVEQNGLTPIAPLSRRLDILGRLDLRPILPTITGEVLVLQGNEDRLVPRRHFEGLMAGLPRAQGAIMPLVGHQPHFTHAEALAQTIADFLLPCAPGGCPNEGRESASSTP